MKNQTTYLVLLTLLLLLSGQACFGQHVGWLPGDSMFPGQSFRVGDFGDGKAVFFVHPSYPGDPSEHGFFSYGGFHQLVLTTEDDDTIESFTRGLERAQGILKAFKRNNDCSLVYLVYDSDFDFHRRRIGLPYNEHWMDRPQQKESDDRRSMGIAFRKYNGIMTDPACVALDWADAAKTPPLKARLPEGRNDWKLAGEVILDPVTLPIERCRVCIVAKKDLDACCLGKNKARCLLTDWTGQLRWMDWDSGRLKTQFATDHPE